MENASKALLIAAEVLIAIMLLTLFSYIFTKMSEDTAKIEEKAKVSKITEFNQEFLNYEGRGTIVVGTDSSGNNLYNNPITIQDVATLINLAIDNNKNYKLYTNVKIKLGSDDLASKYNNGSEWLKKNITSEKIYRCNKIDINSKSRLVETVWIEQI